MKINKLEFSNHEVLNDLAIDFTDETGTPLDIVVFIGDNGTGKTRLLEAIVEVFNDWRPDSKNINDTEVANDYLSISLDESFEKSIKASIKQNVWTYYKDIPAESPQIVWMPTGLNIKETSTNPPTSKVTLVESASDWNLKTVSDYIVDIIDTAVYDNKDVAPRVVIKKMATELNDIFDLLNLSFELTGVTVDNGKTPKFRNILSNEEFDINSLSSGEKHLFLSILSLKRLKVNNAIIIIDEPETSLHPEWQRKIIDVYKNVGKNNQLIIATHSPLIVGSVPSESIRILSRNEAGRVEITHQDADDQTYGKSVEDILKITMDLASLRNEETTRKLDRARTLLEIGAYDSADYKELIAELQNQLGSADRDIMRIEMQKSVRMRENAENN